MDFGGGDEIRFERRGKAGVVTLMRPAALNALTHRMILALARALREWQDDAEVKAVVLTAEGRAFCAGGDLQQIYRAGRQGAPPVKFFADEYRLNASIARFPKPWVSLIDGVVMGGGVGISFHGSHRVMSEKAAFAMPEVDIGFFPDVGGSFLLSRLKGSLGLFLALTGARLKAGDARRAGLATHAVVSADFARVLDGICETGSPDKAIKPYVFGPTASISEADLLQIRLLFSRGSIADLMLALRQGVKSGEAVARLALEAIEKASPTSVAVAFRQINTGAMLDIDECMRMEFRIVNRMLAGHDFYEGIRAALIDKDDAPKWRPASLAAIDAANVDAYFVPLPGGDRRL